VGNNLAFQACGKTYLGNVTNVSQQIVIVADAPCNQMLAVNPGNAAVFFAVGPNISVTANIPGNGTAQYTYAMAPASNMVVTIPQQFSNTSNIYVSFIAAAGTGSAYFTPGEGLIA
jgi:hypothetical protein